MSAEKLKYFRFKGLLQREDWLAPAYIGIDGEGLIKYLSNQPNPMGTAIEAVEGYALPGFQNAHSHAFQYAMAGLAENHPAGKDDDFWTWREEMYKCALLADPDDVEAIATMLYAEMLRYGYTHVAEFHYLHHDKNGNPYSNLAEISERLVAAAKTSGIKITLIPVFYQKGGFGLEPQPRQKRFISKSVDDYFKLVDAVKPILAGYVYSRLGLSVHSLRAVDLKDVIRTVDASPKDIPFHLHVAEQKKEVNDCLAFCGKRPMEWLLQNTPVNERFHLVHATHLDDGELGGLINSKANVVLCPSTEGNLGDGIFRMKEYCAAGGRWTIGTDSHIGINPIEEFRMIDYRQRLLTNKRNTFAGDGAKYMVNEEISSGRNAMGLSQKEHFSVGSPLDAFIVDAHSPLIASTSIRNLLSTIIYTADTSCNLGTIVNGKWAVRRHAHENHEGITARFRAAIGKIQNR